MLQYQENVERSHPMVPAAGISVHPASTTDVTTFTSQEHVGKTKHDWKVSPHQLRCPVIFPR